MHCSSYLPLSSRHTSCTTRKATVQGNERKGKMKISKIKYETDNVARITTENGQVISVALFGGSEEPTNIGASGHVGYCIHGKTSDGFPCRIDFDFGTIEQDSLDLYDWRLESDDTEARLIVYA